MGAPPSEPTRLRTHSLVDPPGSGESKSRHAALRTSSASIREVLACVDGSELGCGVVPHAEELARALGARLTLLRVLETDDSSDAPMDSLDWGMRRREARAHLDGCLSGIGKLEAGTRSELVQGRAAEQICSWVSTHDVDLTVLCSHGTRGLSDWNLASTARKLIDRAPGSVLLVPAAAAAKPGPVHYQRIVVPLDGSPRSESVLPIAMRIAAAQQAEIVLVNVVPVPDITRTGPTDAAADDLERRVVEHNTRVASSYLDRLRARIRQDGVSVRTMVVGDGSVRVRLERLIREEGTELVVMSAHGKTGWIDSPFGVVAEYVTTHATTPLLLLRERSLHRARRTSPPRALGPETAPDRARP